MLDLGWVYAGRPGPKIAILNGEFVAGERSYFAGP